MRTKKESVKRGKGVRKPGVRVLKIYPKFRDNLYSKKEVPQIKLCGNWLLQHGFEMGKSISVTTMPQLLIIRVQPD